MDNPNPASVAVVDYAHATRSIRTRASQAFRDGSSRKDVGQMVIRLMGDNAPTMDGNYLSVFRTGLQQADPEYVGSMMR